MWSIDFDREPESVAASDTGSGDLFRGVSFPRDLLERHGARLLDPAAAPLAAGAPVPGSTVYRSDALLVPVPALRPPRRRPARDPYVWITDTLAGIGLTFDVPDLEGVGQDGGACWRPITLRVAEQAKAVVAVDAWVALQELRRNLPPFDGPGQDAIPEDPDDERDPRRRYGRQIGLDHILVGSAYSGIGAAAGIGGEPATDGHGVPGYQIAAPQADFSARHPVQLVLDAPSRRDGAAFERVAGRRRPVIALIDSGVLPHPWLPFSEKAGDDTVILVSGAVQERIEKGLASDQAPARGARPLAKISGYLDSPTPVEPLLGLANAQVGHCVFEAGLIYQIVPDARILVIRGMHADGAMRESALLIGLEYVAEQVRAAQADPAAGLFVDVVSLSCGYFAESEDDRLYTVQLRKKLRELRALGVVVVAASGNYATTRAMQPAGAASIPLAGPAAPMLAVGAKNPDGSTAIFSNEGKAVQYHAPGVALVSTFPPQVQGAQSPVLGIPGSSPAGRPPKPARTSLDGDNYAGGFAAWSGTSFATPIVAATIVRRLVEQASAEHAQAGQAGAGHVQGAARPSALEDVSAAAAIERAAKVVAGLAPPPAPPGS
ncbi:S8 family serine peptidase [Sphaerisporangium corydalis]|uniref:S8 family serine peptidase n=1 Tax=Sphaerisporangium corydalis TaxID=1441875 RepID=A0ABV9ENP8_9ACTN|nr:S8 family serine peptidase [Sphaerisporangium corydalis]